MSSWERGYGDFEMKPDLDTLRPIPWHEGTVLLMADLQWHDGSRGGRLAAPDPAPPARPAGRARAGRPTPAPSSSSSSSRTPTRRPGSKAYRDLEPANLYNVDYSLLGTARVEPLIRRIRNEMAAAGMTVENSKGECNLGQHEINFRYGEALRGRRRPRDLQERRQGDRRPGGMSITFMAKFNEREGNSCHIHCSLADEDGENAFARRPAAVRPLPRRPARLPARADPVLRAARQLLQALRRRARSRPTAVAWGNDNRTCSMRVVGHGRGAAGREPAAGRRRQPLPGAGGDDRRRPARDRRRARARAAAGGQRLRRPTSRTCRPTCTTARDLFAGSEVAREAFGQEVVDHYLNRARVELEAHRGGGHRLGAVPGLRAAVMARRPVIGICAAVEQARWAVWEDIEVNISQRTYSDARRRRRRRCRCCCRPTTRRPTDPGRGARPARRA